MKYLNNMEINNYDINLDSLVIHWVGNKSNDDGITISKHKVELTENTSSILLKYFISSFKYDDLYKFHHTSNLELNEVYNYVSNIFQNRSCILEQSQLLAKFLYELSTHPNIKSGEFYIAYFTNCEVENINTDAIGIFKSENKETDFVLHKIGFFDIWEALTKKIPSKNENSGFRFDPFSFLHSDFLVFHFGCLISTREGNTEKIA